MRYSFRQFSLGLGAWFLLSAGFSAHAVLYNGIYDTTEPNSSQVANWPGGTSPWDYVGTVNNCSGVYLGNGWVISAAHIGVTASSTYTLTDSSGVGTTYSIAAGSVTQVGSADLVMFRLNDLPSLAAITMADSSINPFNTTLVMIGYGDGNGSVTNKTWGQTSITDNSYNNTYTLVNGPYTSTTFYAQETNAHLITGDSGGGAFVYNFSTGEWELAGILDAVLSDETNTYSASVKLSPYATQINTIMAAVPEPGAITLVLLGLGCMGGAMIRRPRRGR